MHGGFLNRGLVFEFFLASFGRHRLSFSQVFLELLWKSGNIYYQDEIRLVDLLVNQIDPLKLHR